MKIALNNGLVKNIKISAGFLLTRPKKNCIEITKSLETSHDTIKRY